MAISPYGQYFPGYSRLFKGWNAFLEELPKPWRQKNINKIREISHKIKPSLQVIGAAFLQQKIDLLKRKIMEDEVYDEILCQDVLDEFNKCESEINDLLTKDYAW